MNLPSFGRFFNPFGKQWATNSINFTIDMSSGKHCTTTVQGFKRYQLLNLFDDLHCKQCLPGKLKIDQKLAVTVLFRCTPIFVSIILSTSSLPLSFYLSVYLSFYSSIYHLYPLQAREQVLVLFQFMPS